MNKALLLFLSTLLFNGLLYGQQIETSNFDHLKLEHLVKENIDKVRLQNNCKPLANDSTLYLAAQHHSGYMLNKKRITHYEENSKKMKTPQDRAEFFGAINYGVGENVMYTSVNANVKGKNNVNFNTSNYQELAKAIVHSWVHSPGHFKNIITSDYNITGVSISIDQKTKRVYACQKFAQVYYKYKFIENKKMFPLSNYQTALEVNSFDSLSNTLIPFEYPFNLKHNQEYQCTTCTDLVKNQPFITLRFERNSFILKIENAAYAKQLLKNKKDGFAVEIVPFDDYMCGNPEYYTKPSRRNGQLKLNGNTLKPRYTKGLYPGYKKRKKRSDVKFIPYIFKSDSIAFFKRFGRYKVDRYKHEYFEINLGRLPKGQKGYWNHNLVYLQNNQICHIDFLTGYCGELIGERQPSIFIPAPSDGEYHFELDKQKINFRIPYKQGDTEFTNERIAPFIKSLEDHSYLIDSIHINAYASVEGDSVLNHKIQMSRAMNIASLLQSRQDSKFKVSINTKTDWKHFRKSVGAITKWKYLN